MKEKIYNLVLKDIKHKTSFIEDMKKDSGDEYVPAKKCLALNNTNVQRRVLVFRLTEEEAKKLEKDPRVEAIQQKLPFKIRPTILDPDRDYGEEKKTIIQAGPAVDAVAAIHRVPTGEDVDVVVVDGHIDPNNPEFAVKKDGSGGSRVNQIDWFNVLYPYGAPDQGFYPVDDLNAVNGKLQYIYEPYVNPDNEGETEANDHGAHVGGIIAGNTQGWAPKSNIYNISPYHGQMIYQDNTGTHDLYLHAIKVWHENKPVNVKKGTKNPTITNHSYGFAAYQIDTKNIIDVTYRGVKHTSPRNYSGALATTKVSAGKVVSGIITNQGRNYTNEPTISFYGGGQATAIAYIGNGTICELTITDPGEGYNENEEIPITFSPAPSGGQTAAGTVTINSNFFSASSIGFTRSSRDPLGPYYIRLTNRGSGYTTAPTITFPPPPNGGRTAKATCKIKSGVLRDIIVNNNGTNYLEIPSVILSGGNPSVPASIVLSAFDNGTIGGIFIDYIEDTKFRVVQDNIDGILYDRYVVESIKWTWMCGEGYKSVPTISFYGGNSVVDGVKTGDKVEARAVMGTGVNQGKVIGINITHQGSGYTSAPGVVFTNGGGFSKEQLDSFGLISYTSSNPLLQGKRFIDIASRDVTLEADLVDMMNSGIVVVTAAGNNSTKIDVPGGVDYDNKLNVIITGLGSLPEGIDPVYYSEYMYEMYYHRGATPTACPNVISVGSLSRSSAESKNTWSDTGPKVDVYAPGDMIASTTHSGKYLSDIDVRSEFRKFEKKLNSISSWDAQVYSNEGFVNVCYCSAKASQTNGYTMFGLNSDPTTDAGYDSIDYAWHFTPTDAYIYESGYSILNVGSYTTSTVFKIEYDGNTITYWKDGVGQRTVSRPATTPLYFDSSIYSPGSGLNSVIFGPGQWTTNFTDNISINKNKIYFVSKLSGTSMASPQVCGMIASHATINRNINQLTAIEFVRNSSRNTVKDTGGSYSDLTSLLGGVNRCAYYPNISYTLYS